MTIPNMVKKVKKSYIDIDGLPLSSFYRGIGTRLGPRYTK